MTTVDKKEQTVVIKRPYNTVQNVCHNRVALALKTKMKSELMTKARPMKLTEIISDYRFKEDDNLRHINKATESPKDTANRRNVNTEVVKDEKLTGIVSHPP